MEQQQHSAKARRLRKFLLVLPAITLPFLVFLLWSVGLVGGKEAKAQDTDTQHGLNSSLPDAKLKDDKGLDKLSFYAQAARDSARIREQWRNDPYYKTDTTVTLPGASLLGYDLDVDDPLLIKAGKVDDNEKKVMQKVAQIKKQLSSHSDETYRYPYSSYSNSTKAVDAGEEVEKLEALLKTVKEKGTAEQDGELVQLDAMMDKIMDIQHPERVKERLATQAKEQRNLSYDVTASSKAPAVSIIQKDTPVQKKSNTFYSIADDRLAAPANTVEAVIHETQTVVSGAVVRLRITRDVSISNHLLPAGSFIYGTATLSGERLQVNISSVRTQNNILPVSLSVYDMDGLEGIYIPGAISRDAAKQSADQAISGIGLMSLDPSLGAQAASAGIQAAKSLAGKKVKLIRVNVKDGYSVLLKNNRDQQLFNQ